MRRARREGWSERRGVRWGGAIDIQNAMLNGLHIFRVK